MDFNSIPKQGTFGAIVDKINANFTLISNKVAEIEALIAQLDGSGSSGGSGGTFTETDPTVPSWAKAESKPSYSASEVGAVATSDVGAASGVCPLNASSKIDSSYLPNGAISKAYLGTCATAASTYAKEALVETFPLDSNNKPLVGTLVGVKYSNTNTYKTAGHTYTLNVNSTGAYPMYYNNAELATSTSANTLVAGYKNRYVFYVFNGTQWVFVSASYDSNSTYSAMSQAEVTAGTGTTGRTLTPTILRTNFYTKAEIDALLAQ